MIQLSIKPCVVAKGKVDVKAAAQSFVAMLNPSTLKRGYTINYDSARAVGNDAQEQKFGSAGDETLNFDLLLDGTGVVSPGSMPAAVEDQVELLRAIVYKYDGDDHQPHVVRIQWGGFIFYGRLQSLSLDYTLFAPSGSPLRAKLALGFVAYRSSRQTQLEANRHSPDLTREIEVKAGDSLPLLCQRVYDDSAYYLAVARYNRITNFRALAPGTKLIFPPLR